jgi:hypothetical protein
LTHCPPGDCGLVRDEEAGDLKEVDMVDLKYAAVKAEQLLDKVRSFTFNKAEDK